MMAEPRDHKFREQWWKQVESDPNPDLTDGLLAAAYAISTKARVDGTRALMSNRRLAQILKKNDRTAQRYTRQLRELGYLELVERGGRRGNGTIAANIYALSLPDTHMSSWDDSQHDTQMSPRDDSQHDISTPQHDIWVSQHDISTPQHDTQMSPPSLNPFLNPSPNPLMPHSPSAVETAVVNSEPDTHPSNGSSNVGFGIGKQDQKRQEEEARCQTCGVAEPRHEQWIADSGDPHEFVPAKQRKAPTPVGKPIRAMAKHATHPTERKPT